MMRRAASAALGVAITAAVVWYLLTPEILREFRSVAATARFPVLVFATALTALVQWLRAWRFAIMTDRTFALPGAPLVWIAFKLNFLNYALPFRIGELGYPLMMRRAHGHPVQRSLGVLLLVRLFDLFTVGAIFLFLAAWLGIAGSTAGSFALFAGAALAGLVPIGLVFGARAARPLFNALLPSGRLADAIDPSLQALGAHRAQLAAIVLSVAIWLLFGAVAALAASAVADDIPPLVAMLGAAAGNVAFALPVNGIGGVGASQAAWVFVVSRAGIAWNDAVISAFALYAVTLAGALLFGGLAWAFEPAQSGGAAEREARRKP
jgi:hypothetical protein